MAKKVIIVGAGMSGLIAAHVLEQMGFEILVIEKTNKVGGRLKTEIIEGVPLDHGFQVLLTAYPMVNKYLNLDKLDLHFFKPGALVVIEGKARRIGDPMRDFSALLPTLFASVGSLSDKLKIFKLSRALKRKSVASIFGYNDITTTWDYLKQYGFSNTIIHRFFHPFFSGIFLEDELRTPSSMFEFVFKMFAQGRAAVPKKGIGQIPEQLKDNLKKTMFRFNTSVTFVRDKVVGLQGGEVLEADAVLCTFPINEKPQWKSCDNLYFEVKQGVLPTDLITLLPDENQWVNNLHLLPQKTAKGTQVVSVTVVKSHKMTSEKLQRVVSGELKTYSNLTVGSLLNHFHIPNALPEVKPLKTPSTMTSFKNQEGVYMAGDFNFYGSLNAAMEAGELAAFEIAKNLT